MIFKRRPRQQPEPMTAWKPSKRAATYRGISTLSNAVAQLWEVNGEQVATIFPTSSTVRFQSQWCREFRGYRALLYFPGDLKGRGPWIDVYDLARGEEKYALHWPVWSELLGQPAPWWLRGLRHVDLISRWRPGICTEEIVVSDAEVVDPLLRVAAMFDPVTPAHRAPMQVARAMLYGATESVQREHDLFSRTAASGSITFPFVPAVIEDPDDDDDVLTGAQTRSGWATIMNSHSDVAEEAMRAIRVYGASELLPCSAVVKVDPGGAAANEWIDRLKPAIHSAQFELFDYGGGYSFLMDPVTDTAAVQRHDGFFEALVPDRLASFSPLAEVILGGPDVVWVRVADGTLHHLPQYSSSGINWGYTGSGPATLAATVDRLLDDITAHPDPLADPPEGLMDLFAHGWKKGTVLTRKKLEKARR